MLGVTLGSLYVDAQGYFPALLDNLHINIVCLALELVGSWVVVGFSVGMEAFGQSFINVPCSQELSGVLRFWA